VVIVFLSVFGPSHDELIPILVRLASMANAYNRVLVDFPFWKNSLCLHDGTIRRTILTTLWGVHPILRQIGANVFEDRGQLLGRPNPGFQHSYRITLKLFVKAPAKFTPCF
jgi:hypothetical protein